MSIHQEVSLPATTERVYQLLTDKNLFATATERPAEIDASEGGAFSIFGGYIQGRLIELVPNERIVQTWRGIDWKPGVHSVVRFALTPEGSGSKLAVDHDSYPEGPSPMFPSWHEHLFANWPVFYFEPIAKYFAANSQSAVV